MEALASMKRTLSIFLIFNVLSTAVTTQVLNRYKSEDPCIAKGTCSECLQVPSCAWCFDRRFSGSRCFAPSFVAPSNARCREEFVLNPDNILAILENRELTRSNSAGDSSGTIWGDSEGSMYGSSLGYTSSGSGYSLSASEASHQIVQIAPQRVRLQLRPRLSYNLFMKYRQVKDYAVDLYYLMDFSKSMEDDKETLTRLGEQLVRTMKNITSDFRIGFGSFVDKIVMPYISTTAESLREPCHGCASPYGYRHAMALSTDTHQFINEVRRANVSGNLDFPEGSLDALMQAIVCREQIGWREAAKKIIVLATDASFHIAGDGKLGGIVKPNDGKCHLDEHGIYTKSESQDYPSVGQVQQAVKKNQINVIFVVTKEQVGLYQDVANNIEGSSVGILSRDSSNIIDLIKEHYQHISSTIELRHNASKAVNISFYTSCLHTGGELVKSNQCNGLKVGDTVQFRIDIEVVKCPKHRKDYFQTIEIYPVGSNESLLIDLEMLCGCNCEVPGDRYYESNALYCSLRGTYKCGICECDPGFFGDRCECIQYDTTKNVTIPNCQPPGSNLECSGRGQCVCGQCACETREREDEKIYGDYCECDNFSCERHDGELCSGHGVCECGVCLCEPGWIGQNCACANSVDTCKPSGSEGQLVCSDHGVCECGACVCEHGFTGQFCEKRSEN